jgi:hypothetical protein
MVQCLDLLRTALLGVGVRGSSCRLALINMDVGVAYHEVLSCYDWNSKILDTGLYHYIVLYEKDSQIIMVISFSRCSMPEPEGLACEPWKGSTHELCKISAGLYMV